MAVFKTTSHSDAFDSRATSTSPSASAPYRTVQGSATVPMLTPTHAWRILCRRTGGGISRTTFYRWLSSGKVYSIRLGFRLFVPYPALEELIKQCLAGERC